MTDLFRYLVAPAAQDRDTSREAVEHAGQTAHLLRAPALAARAEGFIRLVATCNPDPGNRLDRAVISVARHLVADMDGTPVPRDFSRSGIPLVRSSI